MLLRETTTPTIAAARIAVVGPPGLASQPTYADLAEALGLPHVSTGRLIGAAIRSGTPLGRAARRFVDRGLLVPDPLVLRLVGSDLRDVVDRTSAPRFLLTGAPRSIRQAEALVALTIGMPIDVVVHLRAPEGVIRRHLGADCRGPDDRVRAQRRLSSYRVLTLPALAWLARRRPVVTVDATVTHEDMRAIVLAAVDVLRTPGMPA